MKLLALGGVLSAALRWGEENDVTPENIAAGRGQLASLPLLIPPASWLHGWPMHLLRAELHLWLIYLWASACLDIGSLLVLLSGHTTAPPFNNPLLASRSLGEG